jgi:hypothetical protein
MREKLAAARDCSQALHGRGRRRHAGATAPISMCVLETRTSLLLKAEIRFSRPLCIGTAKPGTRCCLPSEPSERVGGGEGGGRAGRGVGAFFVLGAPQPLPPADYYCLLRWLARSRTRPAARVTSALLHAYMMGYRLVHIQRRCAGAPQATLREEPGPPTFAPHRTGARSRAPWFAAVSIAAFCMPVERRGAGRAGRRP